MNKEQAERLIIAEMRKRLPRIPATGEEGFLCFLQLHNERPELFEFRHAGSDPWQPVSGWLSKHGLIAK